MSGRQLRRRQILAEGQNKIKFPDPPGREFCKRLVTPSNENSNTQKHKDFHGVFQDFF